MRLARASVDSFHSENRSSADSTAFALEPIMNVCVIPSCPKSPSSRLRSSVRTATHFSPIIGTWDCDKSSIWLERAERSSRDMVGSSTVSNDF